jgi:hypothetical protein
LPPVKISHEWVTNPEQSKSSGKIVTFSHWTGIKNKTNFGKITGKQEKMDATRK